MQNMFFKDERNLLNVCLYVKLNESGEQEMSSDFVCQMIFPMFRRNFVACEMVIRFCYVVSLFEFISKGKKLKCDASEPKDVYNRS